MLINFCNTDLVTNISSSVCECDGYNVKNLISQVEFERKRGFLADCFIKPPISIDFEFVCEIQLSHIILWTRVGGQKSIGVDLHASNSECVNQSIGCAFMKNNEFDGFIFFKNGESSIRGVQTSNLVLQTFKSMNFVGVRNLQIKILKTLASSVPALQRVEIWGKIHRGCPKNTVEFVMNTWAQINNAGPVECDNFVEPVSSSSSNVSNNIPDQIIIPSQSQIPDEFLDPITCEIITIPMILPSGKIIDNSTLERYIKEEEKWGRFPSDPFTGKLFSETNKPKVSTALKIRIDKFLLDNSDKSFSQNLPRAVGNSQPYITGTKESSLISSMKCKANSNSSFSCTSSNTDFNLKLDIFTKTDRHKKRKFPLDANVIPLDGNIKPAKDIELHPRKVQVSSSRAVLKQYDIGSLDKIKERSLDNSLRTILSNLPSYTKNSSLEDHRVGCSKCKSGSILYKLPCKHHLCRLCLSALIETDSCICTICSIRFNSSDPKRVHLTN